LVARILSWCITPKRTGEKRGGKFNETSSYSFRPRGLFVSTAATASNWKPIPGDPDAAVDLASIRSETFKAFNNYRWPDRPCWSVVPLGR
jgi:hypothetical protein